MERLLPVAESTTYTNAKVYRAQLSFQKSDVEINFYSETSHPIFTPLFFLGAPNDFERKRESDGSAGAQKGKKLG